MQLKALVCIDTLNEAFGANSPVARSSTLSFDSLFVLSRMLSVSPLKSKPVWAPSLQGWMRRTMKLAATNPPFIFMPFIRPRSSLTCSMSALLGLSDQLFWLPEMWSTSQRIAGWLYFI